ncbi:hypothetical protein PV326_012435 [Microctonus aethiopoides]|nr:hypothetical protein PV326_012435 [Microctonus aethiopoides]
MEAIKSIESVSNNGYHDDHGLQLLPQSEKNFAAAHLNEDDTTTTEKIQEIRDWIVSNDKLHARTDNFTILRFLRCCKFNLDKTKKKIYNYYAQRIESPDWFSDRHPFSPELQEIFNLGYFLPLRELDAEGRMIIILRVTIHNPRKHQFAHLIKGGKMILDIATKNNVMVSLHGVVVIMDMTGVSLRHALQLTPNVIQRLVHSWQECYPLRIQSFNVVNAPIHINTVLSIFKQFMKPKLREKITIHSETINNFFVTHYPKSCHLLPVEFGGTTGTLQNLKEYWKNEVENNSAWYIEEEKYRVIL